MQTHFKDYFATVKPRMLYPVIMIWGLNIILVIAISIIAYQASQTYAELESAKTSLQEARDKVTLITANQQLTKDQLDTYNVALSQLIPDEESYFLVISALEQISSKTGFKLSRYSINLSSTTAEKLSLSVEGTGDLASFMNFIENYQFAGGRLVTNEKLEFSPGNLQGAKISLNFYHKKSPQIVTTDSQLTQEDISFMDNIVDKLRN